MASRGRLHILEGQEGDIPKEGMFSSLPTDVHYFDWDSLCRMYGEKDVSDYLRSIYGSDWVLVREDLKRYSV